MGLDDRTTLISPPQLQGLEAGWYRLRIKVGEEIVRDGSFLVSPVPGYKPIFVDVDYDDAWVFEGNGDGYTQAIKLTETERTLQWSCHGGTDPDIEIRVVGETTGEVVFSVSSPSEEDKFIFDVPVSKSYRIEVDTTQWVCWKVILLSLFSGDEEQLETTFGAGLFRVGKDIAPGTYRNSNSAHACYWERLSGLGGGYGDIIAAGVSLDIVTVSIKPSDAGFFSMNCGTWTQVSPY
jgi:hypothetical protein